MFISFQKKNCISFGFIGKCHVKYALVHMQCLCYNTLYIILCETKKGGDSIGFSNFADDKNVRLYTKKKEGLYIMKKLLQILSITLAIMLMFGAVSQAFAEAASIGKANAKQYKVPLTSEQIIAPSEIIEEADDEQPVEEKPAVEESETPLAKSEASKQYVTKKEYVGSHTQTPSDDIVSAELQNADAGINGTQLPKYENVSVTLGSDGLTVIVRGISEKSKNEFISLLEDNIEISLKDNKSLKIVIPDLLDAEKYMLAGYDTDLCWAATAANMLWSSNYAQRAINPVTNETFKNVDEVFDYFRQIFTDNTGRPDGAISVFLSGDYPFKNVDGWSQLKNGNTKGLLPELSRPDTYAAYPIDRVDMIRVLENLKDYSLGVLLHSIDIVSNTYTALAHWVTATGVVINQNANTLEDRYKAIIIANSDNDPVYGTNDIPDAQKAEQAAQADNSYTLYPLALLNFGNIGPRWSIPYYSNNQLERVVIDWFTQLKDITPVTPDQPDQPDQPEKPDKPSKPDQPEEPETPDVSDQVDSQPHDDEKIVSKSYFKKIEKLMVKEDLILYSPTEWNYNSKEDDTFDVFVRTPSSALLNVFVDETALTQFHKDIEIIDLNTGIFLIRINAAVMKELAIDDHTFMVQLTGVGDVAETIHVI